MDAPTAKALGFITHLVDPADVSKIVNTISSSGKPEEKYPCSPSDPSHPVSIMSKAFYSDANMGKILSGEVPEGFDPEDKNVSRQLKSISRAAPVAVRLANELLDKALSTDLATGLQLELDALNEIFATQDACEGLTALVEGRRPEYVGS
jgi:enoyl-CoA hydratase/carnithine racemase